MRGVIGLVRGPHSLSQVKPVQNLVPDRCRGKLLYKSTKVEDAIRPEGQVTPQAPDSKWRLPDACF